MRTSLASVYNYSAIYISPAKRWFLSPTYTHVDGDTKLVTIVHSHVPLCSEGNMVAIKEIKRHDLVLNNAIRREVAQIRYVFRMRKELEQLWCTQG